MKLSIEERCIKIAKRIAADNNIQDEFARANVLNEIYEEFRDDWNVVIVTKSGMAGGYRTGDRQQCEIAREHLQSWVDCEDRHPEASTTFDPFGMGYGAPCPIAAIERVLLLAPGEQLPEEASQATEEMATKFHEALSKVAPKHQE